MMSIIKGGHISRRICLSAFGIVEIVPDLIVVIKLVFEVLAFINKVKNDPLYANMQQRSDRVDRLENLERHFTAPSLPPSYLQYLVHR